MEKGKDINMRTNFESALIYFGLIYDQPNL